MSGQAAIHKRLAPLLNWAWPTPPRSLGRTNELILHRVPPPKGLTARCDHSTQRPDTPHRSLSWPVAVGQLGPVMTPYLARVQPFGNNTVVASNGIQPKLGLVPGKCQGFPCALFEGSPSTICEFVGFPNGVFTCELGSAGFPASTHCRPKGLDNFVYVKQLGFPNQFMKRKSMSLIASKPASGHQ